MFVRILLLMILISLSVSGHGIPAQRLALLSKGVNIPHWYWMRPSHTLIDHHMNDEDIENLIILGMRHVRIPFDMVDLENPRLIKQFKADIKRFTHHKIGVIVSAFGQKYNRDLISTGEGLEMLKRFCSLIRQTPVDFVFLQIANEPMPDNPKNWPSIQNKLLHAARLVLPHHTLITSTPLKFDSGLADWDMIKAFSAITPDDDQNVVYAFHFYEPYLFTHQNAAWDRYACSIKQLAYPANATNVREVISRLPKGTPPWMTRSLFISWNKGKLREVLKPILDWREKHQRPIMVTEFGVYKSGVDSGSRARWLSDMVSLFREEKLLWTLWDYDGGFGLFNREKGFRELDIEMAKVLG